MTSTLNDGTKIVGLKKSRKGRGTYVKRDGDYIDNEKFLREITKYRTDFLLNKDNPDEHPMPRISEYIGYCFLKIATGLSMKRNFYGYAYRDEMISDGYFDCVKYAHVFNPEKFNNPFAYFTQVCYYAFIRKIGKEKKHYYTLCKAIENSEIFGLLTDSQGHDENDMAIVADIGYSKDARINMSKFIEDFETTKDKKKNEKRSPASGTDSIFDQDDE